MLDTQPRSLTELVPVEPFRRPNVVLVVLDCVAEWAIAELERLDGGLSLPSSLQGQLVRFSRSVSSGSWTLPSHASLLTGLAPWEHGVHGRGSWKLPEGVPTLAEGLGKTGYASACVSANGFLGPFSGLCRGFDETHVGSWSEILQRGGHRAQSPVQVKNGSESTAKGQSSGDPSEGAEFGALLRRFLLRNPGLLSSSARGVYKLAYPDEAFDLTVSSWVEPTLETWLRSVPADRPTFVTINYLDAHEPYYREDAVVRGGRARLRYAWTSQDQTDYLVHPRPPGDPGVQMLRQLYLGRVRYLVQRLGRLVDVLERVGRWEETLLLVTADHGQAFGTGGAMFHGLSIDDTVLRVPLWVRFPGGRSGGRALDAWTSSLDVAATIRACGSDGAGAEASPPPRSGERSVLAVSDGVTELATGARFPKATQDRLDHVLIAVYGEGGKVAYDACHDRVLSGTEGAPPVAGPAEGLEWARRVGKRMLGTKAPRSDHLAAWGYE
jgi:arylsulfatase A-like enzyme